MGKSVPYKIFEIIESFRLSKWLFSLREGGAGGDPWVENLIIYLHECWGNSSSQEKFLGSSFVRCGASPPPLAKLLYICLLKLSY